MVSRRRAKGNFMVVIYWRDIPAQVTASHNGQNHKILLEPRFQHAIDRAATVAGLTDTHDYVGEWRQVRHPLQGEAASAVAQLAEELNTTYDRERVEALVASGGLD